MAAAADDVLVARQLFRADRTACVDAAGGYTDLGAHAELAAIRKLCRRILQQDRAVHVAEELRGRVIVIGNDALGVAGAVFPDVANRR